MNFVDRTLLYPKVRSTTFPGASGHFVAKNIKRKVADSSLSSTVSQHTSCHLTDIPVKNCANVLTFIIYCENQMLRVIVIPFKC